MFLHLRCTVSLIYDEPIKPILLMQLLQDGHEPAKESNVMAAYGSMKTIKVPSLH